MQRRTFLGVLGCAGTAWATMGWPIKARAENDAPPVVGFLRSTTESDSQPVVAAFREALGKAGYVDGRDVSIGLRFANNRIDQLAILASELTRQAPAVIVANSIAAGAAKAATSSTPIVFVTGSDPVRDGLVPELSRPGANITGVVFITADLSAKRLGLLRQVCPKANTIAVLMYPNTGETEAERSELQEAAKDLGERLLFSEVKTKNDIEAAFASFAQQRIDAVVVGAGPFIFSERELIVKEAARYSLPTIYNSRAFAEVGGFLSYGTSITDAYRQAANYVARILKGEKPGELPVVRSSRFEFVVNSKTAKLLGIEIHPQLLATADEVIE
jgi:ABC-type uncharacterized transport system substrate-binding protein